MQKRRIIKLIILFLLAGGVLLLANYACNANRRLDRDNRQLAAANGGLICRQISLLVQILVYNVGGDSPHISYSMNSYGSCTSFSKSWPISIPKDGRGGQSKELDRALQSFQEQLASLVYMSRVPGVFDPSISASWQQTGEDSESLFFLLNVSYDDEKVAQTKRGDSRGEEDEKPAPLFKFQIRI